MAYSVNWVTKVVTIPKSDLTLVQTVPNELYTLDIADFWTEIINIQDSETGMVYPDIIKNTAPFTAGTTTFARVVEIINGYTITFENGSYGVSLIGGNSNISSNTNFNSVSVTAESSGGLVVASASITSTDLDNIRDNILNAPVGDYTSSGSLGEWFNKKGLTVVKFLGLK